MAEILCSLRGTVTRGKGKGHTVGMPTANLAAAAHGEMPPAGVYATLAEVDGVRYRGVTNVGLRPSVDSDSVPTVETLLLHFSGDLYGKEMTLAFYRYLRGTQKYESLQAVKEQVDRDSRAAEEFFDREGIQ